MLVFGKIRAALGIMSTVISGGGSLARHLDDFYEALALPVLNGWGLTETSPVLACRRNQARENVRGCVGLPIPGTAVRVVDPETLQPVPEGQQARPSRVLSLASRCRCHPAVVACKAMSSLRQPEGLCTFQSSDSFDDLSKFMKTLDFAFQAAKSAPNRQKLHSVQLFSPVVCGAMSSGPHKGFWAVDARAWGF